MDYRELRLNRFKALIRDRFGNKQNEFAEAVDINPSQVSRLLMPEGAPGRSTIGEDLARKIELHLDLPPGYLVMPELDAKAALPVIRPKAWPFKTISLDRFEGLSRSARLQVEGALRGAIVDLEESEISARRKPRRL